MTAAGSIRRGVLRWTVAATMAGAVAFLLIAAPAMARTAKFSVTYGGSGLYTNKTTGHITNDNGRCNGSSTERTNFTYSGVAVLKVTFDDKGMSGDSYKLGGDAGDWDSGPSSSHLTDASSGPGCHPPDHSDLSGSYDCTGSALPHSFGVSEFKLTAAGKDERSRLKVLGPGLFTAHGFSGNWNYATGSCPGLAGDPLLQTMATSTPYALGLNVPIRERTLRRLPVHHYFKVDVGEGHYAPSIDDAQMCMHQSLDTCKQTFGWSGRVAVRRIS